MSELTLIIPAKNESECLPVVLQEIKDHDVKIKVLLHKEDFLTINSIKNENCEIIYQNNRGYGDALIQGINLTDTKYFCIFNADGSFDPSYLNNMYEALEKDNVDFIFCSRYEINGGSDDDTFLTYIGNKIFTFLCNILFRLNISDVLYTYVMGKSEKYKSLDLKSNDFSFCIELPIKAKFNDFILSSTPSYERSRIAGIKKVNEFRDGFLILISILRMLIIRK